jgi:hypothetical protein
MSFYRCLPPTGRSPASKEESMKGYVARKGNCYYAVIYEGTDPLTGRDRRRWYPAGTDKALAEALATDLADRHRQGGRERSSLTVRITGSGSPAWWAVAGGLGRDPSPD